MNILQWSYVMTAISSTIIVLILLGFQKTGIVLAVMTAPVTFIWATVTGQYGFYIGATLSLLVYGLALLQLGKESE